MSLAMKDLPKDERELIQLKVCEGFAYEVLAWLDDVTVDVVRRRVARGLTHLRRAYELRLKSEARHHLTHGHGGQGKEAPRRHARKRARSGRKTRAVRR